MTRWISRVPIFLLLAALPAAAGAAGTPEPLGNEFQVNSYTTDDQHRPAVAVDAEGRFVVVWDSDGSGGSDSSSGSIQGQRFDAAGAPIGAQFQVNTYTPSGQRWPAVAAAAGGDFFVVWQGPGSGSDSSFTSIQGRRFDSAGAPVGDEFQVNTYTTDQQDKPSVAADASGNFVVVWHSGYYHTGYNVRGQRFDSAGATLGGEFQVNTYTTDAQVLPSVAADASGNFVVVWDSRGSSGSDSDGRSIQGQRFDSAGVPLGGEFQVNTSTYRSQVSAAVAADADGDFIVVWEGALFLDCCLRGQRFDSAGTPLGDEFRVSTSTTGYQARPAVAADADGDFVVVWEISSTYGMLGQRFDSRGARVGDEFQVNNTIGDTSLHWPAMAADAGGDFVVAWASYGASASDTDGHGILGRRFGVPIFADGFESGDTTAWSSSVP